MFSKFQETKTSFIECCDDVQFLKKKNKNKALSDFEEIQNSSKMAPLLVRSEFLCDLNISMDGDTDQFMFP